MSELEVEFDRQLMFTGIEHEQQYRFAAEAVGLGAGIRKRLAEAGLKDWRFDFAIPDKKIAVEIEGGIWIKGRHTRGSGFKQDCEKYANALILGWRVLRVTGQHVKSGQALDWLLKLLN